VPDFPPGDDDDDDNEDASNGAPCCCRKTLPLPAIRRDDKDARNATARTKIIIIIVIMDSDDDNRHVEAFEQMRDTLDDVYGPVLFQTSEYATDETGLGLPPEETLEHLWDLFGTSLDFCYLLASNEALLDRFRRRMMSSPSGIEGAAPPVPPSPAMNELDRIIEAALLNHAEFATRQMSRVLRVMKCEPHVRESKKDKYTILYGSHWELLEAGENLRQWGSDATLDAHDDALEILDEAHEFARTLGIDLLED
jgi:hypothetical protein